MDSIDDSLAGRVALVTGACGGIGRAICQRLAAEGVRLVLVDRDAEGVEALASSLASDTFVSVVDVSDAEAVASQHEYIVRQFSEIDILVNCAGILSNNKLLTTDPGEWRHVMSVNLDSALYWSQAVVPRMRDKGFGRIINITSFAWKAGGLTAGTAYTTSKGGMVSLTFSIAREFAGQGITVNGIAPCYVMTPMVSEQLTEEQRRTTLELLPVKRFCTPEEVAHTVRFLASPLSGFITGEIIDMNGGLQFD
ncbi:MAG: 3-oxoacyl-ACP reductase [Gammaproteobacteria bacterium]|nr:3-oxoacyl-ACP reductase [Gammaproteobacteria bacterium]